ncbi:hypothetical protein AtubIFM55763_004477 [Aspergillus tubingensis]|uniref:FAD binding monooxygenase n=2 Tax=Aspergillus subgen. Circumdati TaxID=2720871 RepID=A0A100I6I4_ASPNG|nr:FAD binding monooxygenase [Aspergillus tubingensis]GAQ35582.1 FAD binding monooxygenase [Aspergillus niger]GFN14010.1 FAD binding monooxygenase [Aspergillus tubingensis]GLA65754.1 hypothetical protein AtubIFM54640_007947 [Aspergillus tubingensis]GLA73550.1 hypothetical protein AtubIFM55763_004477 [Aspergillus tubingensis]GLA88372.1 hypothetical protein AtubIFM56815_002823 [Aspergillus tubingensis]
MHTQYPDQSKILTNQRVAAIRPVGSRVNVITETGVTYTGDLVVGADGVHSKVRSEMWRIADTVRPGWVTELEKSRLEVADQVNAFHDNLTFIILVGKNKRAFWFVLKKMDQRYTYPDNPRFSAEYTAQTCEKLAHLHLTKDLTFRQVWDSRVLAAMTPLEENIFQTWYLNRIVCIGDSVHKMTPNIGQGANMAMEDAVVLANCLHAALLRTRRQRLSDSEVQVLLQEFYSKRYSRAKSIYTASRYMTRFQARDGCLNRVLGRYIVPLLADVPARVGTTTIRGSPAINFLPLPERDGPGWKMNKTSVGYHHAMLFTLLLAVAIYWYRGV